MDKVKKSAREALAPLKDGDIVMAGGFGLNGAPLTLIEEISKMPVKDLTIVSNNCGVPGEGLGKLVNNHQIKKAIGSFFTNNPDICDDYLAGKVELELTPQGTLAEKIRAGGAGIPAFYTPTSAGTNLGKGKEEREFDGRLYVMERGLRGNVAIIRAWKADKLGNLIYRNTIRNFNPMMATACDYVVAEVDEIVEVGELDPNMIATPQLFVDAIIKAEYVQTAEGVVKVNG